MLYNCYNKVIINGTKKEIKKLKELLMDDENDLCPKLCFEKIIPVPKGLSGKNRISWSEKHLGTGWDVEYEKKPEWSEKEIRYDFKTYDCLSTTLFEHLTSAFPELRITLMYFEPQLGVAGWSVIELSSDLESVEYNDYEFEGKPYSEFVDNHFGPHIRNRYEGYW